ncbi:ankyrin repeat domain-containing protein [Variovorax sp. J22G73]|jgi:ankyrin repeat protein|uniref:ankyrin repeat domain-containing protein n=1 Tax=unclassified Variovorax TaxID=663243 RepID=UPI000D5DCE0C|nr:MULTISPECIES: ankyrin repeat domain-containing protein [unclassified Variovorax]MDM0006556.1 ankyrin repeat domain-containing protein [Variovorax sp. J22R203]MDM0097420.1 ankyrin repeat domain-containing protein [Variovorax sp. J22G73]
MFSRGIGSGVSVIALAAVLGLGAVSGARAQVPPLAAEVLAYDGLHQAAWQGDLPKLKALVASGANLDARDPRGRTPLHVATHARQREAIKLLAKAGANLDLLEDDRYDAVTIASVADDAATLSLLLSLGANAGQTTSRYDGTALIAAAHLGHDEVVRRLIAAGAPLDHVNNLHWTAVIESIVLGDGGPRHQRTLAALVDAGASLKLADRQGNTPLQLAKARGYTAMVKLLETPRAR